MESPPSSPDDNLTDEEKELLVRWAIEGFGVAPRRCNTCHEWIYPGYELLLMPVPCSHHRPLREVIEDKRTAMNVEKWFRIAGGEQ